jgi:hypothetical protein
MQERYFGRIEPDMDVCDINGDKVGTVSHVYRYEMATTGMADAPAAPAAPPHDEVIEVKTGFLGLGSHYYVPVGAIQDVTQGCVFLSKTKGDFEGLGWTEKPAYLNEMQ